MKLQLTDALRQANSAVRAALRHDLTDLGLTPVQSTVLHLISAGPRSSSAELARRMQVTPQTMHKMVTELERRGLLAFQPRPGHGRALDARLTERGQELVAGADARARAIEDRMTEGLDERQRRQLIDLLRHCTEALGVPAEELRESQASPGDAQP